MLVLSHSRRGSQLLLGVAAACVQMLMIKDKEARTGMGGIVWFRGGGGVMGGLCGLLFHGGICVVDGFMAVPAPACR